MAAVCWRRTEHHAYVGISQKGSPERCFFSDIFCFLLFSSVFFRFLPFFRFPFFFFPFWLFFFCFSLFFFPFSSVFSFFFHFIFRPKAGRHRSRDPCCETPTMATAIMTLDVQIASDFKSNLQAILNCSDSNCWDSSCDLYPLFHRLRGDFGWDFAGNLRFEIVAIRFRHLRSSRNERHYHNDLEIPSTPKCLQYKKILRGINFVKITKNIFQSTRLPEERRGVTEKIGGRNEFP